jgi:hypothetical protein
MYSEEKALFIRKHTSTKSIDYKRISSLLLTKKASTSKSHKMLQELYQQYNSFM